MSGVFTPLLKAPSVHIKQLDISGKLNEAFRRTTFILVHKHFIHGDQRLVLAPRVIIDADR